MAQVGKPLSCKYKALSSNPSTAKKKFQSIDYKKQTGCSDVHLKFQLHGGRGKMIVILGAP
jgi:hypothetical protein